MNKCTTHHFACACREAKFRELEQQLAEATTEGLHLQQVVVEHTVRVIALKVENAELRLELQQLTELREAARTARESLMYVLCDPEGSACIDGSSGDLSVINEALALLKESSDE